MRCDLHVHTIHSGMCTQPVLDRICRESFNDPDHVYDTLKRRGMHLVTVTDHDSIDAAERLRRHPDFFLSEEVSCRFPNSRQLHVGVYGIEERDHIEMQRRRDDFPAFLAYLHQRRLLYSVNHAFSGLTGARAASDFDAFAELFPAVETLNGAMQPVVNRYARTLAAAARKIALAGSDSHTMDGLGRTYTEVHGARSAHEYLSGLKRGACTVHGESGAYWKLTRDVLKVAAFMMRERPWTLALLPVVPLVPGATLLIMIREIYGAHRWGRTLKEVAEVHPAEVRA
jgi:predicted metal-dependent phosphoesterase TrpH